MTNTKKKMPNKAAQLAALDVLQEVIITDVPMPKGWYKKIMCPTCAGNKKVIATIGNSNGQISQEIQCPICHGIGVINGEKKYEVVEAYVEQIDVSLSKSSPEKVIFNRANWSGTLVSYVWVRSKKDRESHQLKGVDLFKTKEEAENQARELEKKNG